MHSLITTDGKSYAPRRVFCIGRNYRKHARELGNEPPAEPVIFLKPPTSLVPPDSTIPLPVHGDDPQFEAELVLLLDGEGRVLDEEGAWEYVAGLSLGLDLTLRDVQSRLKRAGLPWELAKAFDHSAAVGRFTPLAAAGNPNEITFSCRINGETRQTGRVREMIFTIPQLLVAISRAWTLSPGDLVYTGTPDGVGSLRSGDSIEVSSDTLGAFTWKIR
jgi:2-keto-4-pentenoate hydratase/2-oxohepta-3-ene-1,7-dioic acid hydratase in catechol pathway